VQQRISLSYHISNEGPCLAAGGQESLQASTDLLSDKPLTFFN